MSTIDPSVQGPQGAGSSDGVVTVRPEREVMTTQRLPYFLGISAATVGARGLAMHLVVIPPGGSATPHSHDGYETGLFVLQGRVETRYGPGLRRSVINEAGDFLFIPPGVPHQPFNLSRTEAARAIVARNDPREEERVTPYDPDSEEPAPGGTAAPPSRTPPSSRSPSP